MKPIVLIHGYSAEHHATIASIYSDLPQALRQRYRDDHVVEIDLSRYISLADGLTLDDVTRALQRVLDDEFPHLLSKGFHAIVHSTGALVIRNWLRRYSRRPSPLNNLIHLAGANFGSGWSHIGQGQFAKWGRLVFQGSERSVRILHALELGSNWTLDLHRFFLDPANSLPQVYRVFEHVVIGSQSDAAWFAAPIRYAKEDGSDGVVRVSASNLNFNYVRFEARPEARALPWSKVRTQRNRDLAARAAPDDWYRFAQVSQPGKRDRPLIPFAIPFDCAHSGKKHGVVTGSACRDEILHLLDLALRTTPDDWASRVEAYNQHTRQTYSKALTHKAPARWKRLLVEPKAQYDPHAQVIVRVTDQDGRPVEHFDVYFNTLAGDPQALPVNQLMQTQHINSQSTNTITFYLRTHAYDADARDWTPRVPLVNGCYFEVSASEPQTDEILYLPLRFKFSRQQLIDFIQPHRTTILDVELLRLPSPNVYHMVSH